MATIGLFTLPNGQLSENMLQAASSDDLYTVAKSMGYIANKTDLIRHIVKQCAPEQPFFSVMEFTLECNDSDGDTRTFQIKGRSVDEMMESISECRWLDQINSDDKKPIRDFIATAQIADGIIFEINWRNGLVVVTDEGNHRLERIH